MKKAMVSKNFSFEELTDSTKFPALVEKNRFEAAAFLASLQLTCQEVMEPIRALFDRPVVPTSGFRGPALNAAVRGVEDSQHTKGEAVDFIIPGVENEEIYERIRNSDIPYDQLILEPGWVHVSRAVTGIKPRRQAWVIGAKA